MKLRHLFVSILAAAGLLMTSCQEKEKDLGLPEIKITQNELALDQNVNSVNLNVYATRNWTVSTAADWISVNPSKGSAYQETAVTVTVLENAGYNRVGTVKFDIGYDSKTLTINQTGAQGEKSEGSGTVDDPYTVAGVLAFIQTLGTETSENAVYIKGKIAAITLTYEASGTYGNARFTMVDEGSTEAFTAYNVLYLGNKKWSTGKTDIKEGDEVIVCSKVFNYGGKTPETATGGYLYSLNGETAGGGGSGDEAKGTGTLDDPYNPAGAAAAVASLTWTSTTDYQTTDPVYVKGKISKIADKGTYTDGGTYGNATFYITETGESTGTEFYVYRILYLGNKKFVTGQTDIKVGDEVIIYGKLMNYRGNTPETASGCYLYSLNGDTGTGGGGGGSDEAKGTGTLADPFNPAGAVNAVKDLTWTSTTEYQTTDEVYVKGKISKIANKGTFTEGGTYGNASFYITETGETGGTEFYAFRILYLKNQKFAAGQTDIKVGDEVIIHGKLMNYHGDTPETVSGAAYLYSLNGSTEPGSGGGQGGGGGEGNKIKFKKVTTVTSGKTYIIVASGTKMAKPIASDKTYGYLNVADVTDNNGVIELDNTDNTFVFTNSDDGWTIKQKDGRFLYQSGTFNSFNVNAAPTEGQYWTVEAQAADGTFKITNKSVNKYIQFDSAYSSYGSYDSAKGALPALYEMDGEDGGSGGGQGGGGTVTGITLSFPDENNANNQVSGYTATWSAKIGSNSWTIANFNNNKWGSNWNFIRGGRKEVASVAEIVTDQAFSKSIAKVVVTYSKVNAADKINSTKLIVATDASFTQGVQEIPMTVTAAGDVTYTVTTPAANCYYKLVFDFAGHTANGIIEITKVVYAE